MPPLPATDTLYPSKLVPPPEFEPQLVSPTTTVQDTSARTLGIHSCVLPLPYPNILTLTLGLKIFLKHCLNWIPPT